MKKNLYSALVAVAGSAAMVSAPAQAGMPDGLDLGFKYAQHFQSVDGDNFDDDTTFNFPSTALDINAQFTPWLSVYAEYTNEEDDNAGTSIKNDLTLINVDVLTAADSAAAENNSLTLQFGTPVGSLSNYFNATDGALAQTNPLIGNNPYRSIDAHTGAKLIGGHQIGGVVKRIDWDFGFYTADFSPDTDTEKGESFELSGKVTFAGGFSAGAGYVASEDNAAFYNSNRGPFNVNGSFDTALAVGSGGPSAPQLDEEAEGWRLEGQYKVPSGMMLAGSKINAWYGEAEADEKDLDVNGDGIDDLESEMEHYGVLAQAYVVPETAYLAARYQQIEHTSGSVSSNNELDRIQIGGGVYLSDNTLLKAEYFDQSEEAFAQSDAAGGSDFDGFGVELSSSF